MGGCAIASRAIAVRLLGGCTFVRCPLVDRDLLGSDICHIIEEESLQGQLLHPGISCTVTEQGPVIAQEDEPVAVGIVGETGGIRGQGEDLPAADAVQRVDVLYGTIVQADQETALSIGGDPDDIRAVGGLHQRASGSIVQDGQLAPDPGDRCLEGVPIDLERRRGQTGVL